MSTRISSVIPFAAACSLMRSMIRSSSTTLDWRMPLVIFRRNHDRHIAVLAADKNGFALRCVEEGSEALLGVGGGDGPHLSIRDKINIMDNLSSARKIL
jgi:hypothetical protein